MLLLWVIFKFMMFMLGLLTASCVGFMMIEEKFVSYKGKVGKILKHFKKNPDLWVFQNNFSNYGYLFNGVLISVDSIKVVDNMGKEISKVVLNGKQKKLYESIVKEHDADLAYDKLDKAIEALKPVKVVAATKTKAETKLGLVAKLRVKNLGEF